VPPSSVMLPTSSRRMNRPMSLLRGWPNPVAVLRIPCVRGGFRVQGVGHSRTDDKRAKGRHRRAADVLDADANADVTISASPGAPGCG
jgi:hypothetical protein